MQRRRSLEAKLLSQGFLLHRCVLSFKTFSEDINILLKSTIIVTCLQMNNDGIGNQILVQYCLLFPYYVFSSLVHYELGVMVFNATFNNISAISWRSVLLVEETGVHFAWAGFELTTLVVIGTDCICSYKSSYHTITTTMAPMSII